MHPLDNSLPANGDTPAYPALTLDPAAFAAYVADFDLNEAQQRELLETVWTFMVAFVDLGFGIHPIQQVLSEDDSKIPVQPESTPMLDSAHSLSTNASTLAECFGACAAERTES